MLPVIIPTNNKERVNFGDKPKRSSSHAPKKTPPMIGILMENPKSRANEKRERD